MLGRPASRVVLPTQTHETVAKVAGRKANFRPLIVTGRPDPFVPNGSRVFGDRAELWLGQRGAVRGCRSTAWGVPGG
jgi:hypothetical protein